MAEPTLNFFDRWSQREALRPAPATAAEVPAAPTLPVAAAVAAPAAAAEPEAAPAPPTLDEAQALAAGADVSRFVGRGVDPDIKNAALKQLFADPHYNVMDGLDIYIDDYGKADPLPPGMLRQMVQSQMLGLFDTEVTVPRPSAAAPAVAPAAVDPATDAAPAQPAATGGAADAATTADPNRSATGTATAYEDPDLQLQPDHGAGRAGPEAGAGGDTGGQHRGP